MEKLKVNVVVAGRTYPLSVKDVQEEEGLRKAAKKINALMAKFEQNYAVADKQDVLAMCALQFASTSEIISLREESHLTEAEEKLKALTKLVESHLQ